MSSGTAWFSAAIMKIKGLIFSSRGKSHPATSRAIVICMVERIRQIRYHRYRLGVRTGTRSISSSSHKVLNSNRRGNGGIPAQEWRRPSSLSSNSLANFAQSAVVAVDIKFVLNLTILTPNNFPKLTDLTPLSSKMSDLPISLTTILSFLPSFLTTYAH
jgi:hypothetical protein